jgi:hypothetical protein
VVVPDVQVGAPRLTRTGIVAWTAPSGGLQVKLRKPMPPVAVPLNCDGLASLITVYGSMAVPDTDLATRSTIFYGYSPRPTTAASSLAPIAEGNDGRGTWL